MSLRGLQLPYAPQPQQSKAVTTVGIWKHSALVQTITKVQKTDIESKKEYDGSLMPVFQLPEKELIDLVEYLEGLRKAS